jgi:hypothetical protein
MARAVLSMVDAKTAPECVLIPRDAPIAEARGGFAVSASETVVEPSVESLVFAATVVRAAGQAFAALAKASWAFVGGRFSTMTIVTRFTARLPVRAKIL